MQKIHVSQLFALLTALILLSGAALSPVSVFACSPPYSVETMVNGVVTCTAPAAAAENASITTFSGLIGRLNEVLNTIVPFIVGLAVFVIFWGIFTYLTEAADEEKRAEAKKFILWGIIGVFMMLSVWGFVNILVNTFSLAKNISPDQIPKVPQITAPVAPGNTTI